MRILAVSGSLRAGSHNTSLLRAAVDAAPEGVEVELFDPSRIADLPVYDQDLDTGDVPRSVQSLREAWATADAILFATPEYNGSVPGGLKNAVDWASRPHRTSALWGKPVVVIGASSGMYGAVWAQADLRKALGVAGARVAEAEIAVGRAGERFDEAGRLIDEGLKEELREALDALAGEVTPIELVAA